MSKTPPPSNYAVAEQLGVDHSMVSRLRSGARLPSYTMVERIRKLYKLSDTETAALVHGLAQGGETAVRAVNRVLDRPVGG